MKPYRDWIKRLNLEPHPEGGYYKEVYRAGEEISKDALPARFSGSRSFSTGIYFLLPKGNFSAFHKINQDELWHHYDGASLQVHIISEAGIYSTIRLGKDPDQGEMPMGVVPAGAYFAAESDGAYSLVGCTVAPGFDFEDFDLPDQASLIGRFPEHTELIKRFTRQ